jgi:hypothetical protein
MVGKLSMDLLILNFLMDFRELGSSLYAYSYFFLFLFFLSFFHSFSHSFIFVIHSVRRLSHRSFDFFYLHPFELLFVNCSPLNFKNCIVPTSSPMLRRLLVLGQRGDRDKVGTRNTFPLERYLKYSITASSCYLP